MVVTVVCFDVSTLLATSLFQAFDFRMNNEKNITNVSTLQIPKELMEALRGVGDKIKKTQKRNLENNLDPGDLSSIEFTQKEKIYLDTFCWLTETNEIVENLNIVFFDLNLFKKKQSFIFEFSGGNIKNRFYLLLRTFFYEFFRIKEIFNIYLNKLRKRKLITKIEASEISLDFYRDYEFVFRLRNQLVHNYHIWHSDDHNEYIISEAAESMGYFFTNKESGEIIKSVDIASKLASENLEGLPTLVTAIIEDLQNVLNIICEGIEKEV